MLTNSDLKCNLAPVLSSRYKFIKLVDRFDVKRFDYTDKTSRDFKLTLRQYTSAYQTCLFTACVRSTYRLTFIIFANRFALG